MMGSMNILNHLGNNVDELIRSEKDIVRLMVLKGISGEIWRAHRELEKESDARIKYEAGAERLRQKAKADNGSP